MSNEIERYFPEKVVFAVWNIDENNFFMPYWKSNCLLVDGIWSSKEAAEIDTKKHKLQNYDILDISVTKIHNDLINIYQNFQNFDIQNMIKTKIAQLLRLYVINNKSLKEELRKKYLK